MLVIETGPLHVTGQETVHMRNECALISICPAVFAILTLLLTVPPGHPLYQQFPSDIIAKVCSNSTVVAVNSRMDISLINGEKLHDAHSTLHFPGALTQGGTRTTEIGGDHGAM